jgi:4-amino-4-deoxy-L-arabinose transferase-like glycosyltransferase
VWRHLSIVLLAGFLTFFVGLGRAAISDSDEAFYAEAAREMVESGDWLTPRYNYEPRFQKPILYYWLTAAAFQAAGVGEAAARFPSALAGLGLALLTYACGRRWLDARAAAIAGLMAATNFGYFSIGRLALPDLPLTFFMTLATFAGLEAVRVARVTGHAAGRPWLLVAAAASALAVLTKGPVGLALPALVVAAGLVLPRPPVSQRWPFPTRDVLLAASLFVVIAAPWYGAMAVHHGPGYLHHFFIGENLERFATGRYNVPRPIYYYAPILAGGLLPWSPFLLLGIPGALACVRRRRPLDATEWRLLLWAGLPLIFYSLSIGKQPRYILPVLPPLALLLAQAVAWRLDRAATGIGSARYALAGCATVAAGAMVTLALLLHRGKPLLFTLDPSSGLAATLAILGAGLATAGLAWLGPPRVLVGTVAAGSIVTLLALHFSVYSAGGLEPVQQVATLVATSRDRVARSGTYRVFVRNLIFYTGMPQTDLVDDEALAAFLGSADRVLCVVAADDLARVERASGVGTVRLGQVRYFNPAGLRLRTLLAPDPEHDLDTVVLVANR